MEKIYSEENNKQKKSIVDFSVVLSFAVAIFAIVSLVACGISQISYAAPEGDSFTFRVRQSADNSGPAKIMGITPSGGQFIVPLYYEDAEYTKPVFCVEHGVGVQDTAIYNKEKPIEDYGIMYILDHSYVNDVRHVTGGNQYVETWITQVALWVYLSEKYPTDSRHALSADELKNIKETTMIKVNVDMTDDHNYGGDGTSIYTKYVRPIVDAAKASTAVKQLNVSKASDAISKTEDGKYYQSSVITVVGTPANDLRGYDIELSGIDGLFAVDETGKKLEGTNVPKGTKFYVRIPANKVTGKVQKVVVNVKGNFSTLSGNYFTAAEGAHQKVVTARVGSQVVSKGIDFEITGAPDTGMTTAQTIYFIGLIVLLCGVGIVYANAKPVESKQ